VEKGIFGKGLEHAGDLAVELVVQQDLFVHRVFVAEIFMRHFFGEHDGEGAFKTGAGISFQHFYVEDVGKVLIGEIGIFSL